MLSKQPRLPASNSKFHSQSESSSPSRSTITKRYSHPSLIAAPQRKFSLQPSPSPQSTSTARQPLLNSTPRHPSSSSSSHKSPVKSISMSLNQNPGKSYSPSTTTTNKTSPLNYRSSSIPVSLNNSPTRLRNVTSPKKELPSTNQRNFGSVSVARSQVSEFTNVVNRNIYTPQHASSIGGHRHISISNGPTERRKVSYGQYSGQQSSTQSRNISSRQLVGSFSSPQQRQTPTSIILKTHLPISNPTSKSNASLSLHKTNVNVIPNTLHMLNQQKSSIRSGRAPSEQLTTSATSSPKPPSSFIPLTSYSKYRYVNQQPSPSHSKSTSPPPQTSAYFPSNSSTTKSKLKPKLALSIDRHSAPSSTAASSNPSASQTTANSTTTSPKSSRIKSASPSVSSSLRQRFESILSTSNYSERELKDSLTKLRKLILTEGIPDDDQDDIPTSAALRCRVWKVLLGIHHISTKEYLNLISKGESEVYQKIRNDTFRTLATDKKFLKNVNESMLIRLLNSFVWAAKEFLPHPPTCLPPPSPSSPVALSSPSSPNPFAFKFSYVQGQNVISAPFLYVMPEVEAFYSYSSFVYNHCPLYVQPALEGVHCGLKLLEKCLKVLDPKLYYCLKKKNLSAELYAFPSVLTFCACTPPLSEVLKLWDFLISYGIHLNVLCVIAQLLLIRADILKSERPMKLLRTFPPLNAKSTITIAVSLVKQLPNDLYDLLVRHPWDPKVLEIMGVGNLGNSSTTNGNGNETTNGNPVQKQKIEVTKDQNKTTKSSVLGTMKTQGHGHGTIRNSEIGLESTPSKAEINDSREDFIQVDDDEEW